MTVVSSNSPAPGPRNEGVPLSETTIVMASPAQRDAIDRYQWVQWIQPRGSVTEDEHVAVMRDREEEAHAADGRAQYWALVPRSDPGTTDILSANRTLRREAKIVRPGTGQIEHVVSYVITGVVTPPSKRKRGYARHMLQLLHFCIGQKAALPSFPKPWGAPPSPEHCRNDATFATLWSDVGREFYKLARIGEERDGWLVQADVEVQLDIESAKVSQSESESAWQTLKSVQDLSQEQLQSAEDEFLLGQNLGADTTAALDSVLSPGTLAYFVGRVKAPYIPADLDALKRDNVGLINARGSFIVFSPEAAKPDEPRPFKVLCARIVKGDKSASASMVARVVQEARRMKCSKLVAWESPAALRQAWLDAGAQEVQRDDHLGAIAWYGENSGKYVGAEGFTWA